MCVYMFKIDINLFFLFHCEYKIRLLVLGNGNGIVVIVHLSPNAHPGFGVQIFLVLLSLENCHWADP